MVTFRTYHRRTHSLCWVVFASGILLVVLSNAMALPQASRDQATEEEVPSDIANEDVAENKIVVQVARQRIKEFDRTVDALSQEVSLDFNDAPMSTVLHFVSAATQLRFRVESNEILTRRVTISTNGPAHDVFISLFAHHNGEMSILPDGVILVRPVPPAVIAIRSYVDTHKEPPSETTWRARSELMTENGLMEQGGNLIWLGLQTRDDNGVDKGTRNAIASILVQYDLDDLETPSEPLPDVSKLSKEEVETTRRQRNKMFVTILGRLKAQTFVFLDEMETTLTAHGIPIPRRDMRGISHCHVHARVAEARILTKEGECWLKFTKLRDDWKFDHTIGH